MALVVTVLKKEQHHYEEAKHAAVLAGRSLADVKVSIDNTEVANYATALSLKVSRAMDQLWEVECHHLQMVACQCLLNKHASHK
jgi:hypothetical protein